ncbi:ADP/ATP-dependent (S)-NAD(P)H-hydrate dehydratase [Microbacterium invictum]|uniref:ADP-dependent (S)-NAD(P)H-hydrate dehydratase n=1 Tax=Microbacterium invictum TaxID=515415 RepID=A0ABZ0VC86_9MICO|nr:ADP/ATP-dependent (S)-NAD(P)H-hydrate dehydratase [Microbacterium invictum]WQB69427.1 ADP/ATP-dependent (S)-NAD(P)H-hydrate dehydratase [Microbacterium invictum]
MSVPWGLSDTAAELHAPTDTDDKYRRGVVGIRTGSEQYPGAAVLGVEAAWRTGVGMVRYLGPDRPTGLVLQRRPETVTASGRVQAWLIGSGTDAATRPPGEGSALRDILSRPEPVVVDAGALDLIADGAREGGVRILTPHDREHDRLRAALGLAPVGPDAGDHRVRAAQETARRTGAVVVLKGARTIVAEPGGWHARVAQDGTSWLATAGTGDVLAGVIGAVIAGAAAREERAGSGGAGGASADPGMEPWARRAAAAVWVHQRAGVRAAQRAAGGAGAGAGPVTALDVADALPAVIAEVLAG